MLERIAKLLNQAENAGTEAEAAVFMDKAQRLARVHSIDLAKARHATKAKERTVPVQRTVHIGEAGTKGLRTLVDLYIGIADANDLKLTIAGNATKVYVVGFAEDIDISEALFASLQVQQARAADGFRKDGSWREEKVWVNKPRDWIGGDWKPQTWLTARLNFQDAYASRIRTRLQTAKRTEEYQQERLDAIRAKCPHLDDDGNPTAEFDLWLEQNHGIFLGNLSNDDPFAVEFCAMLRDADDEWTKELIAEWQTQTQAQKSNSGTELVLVEKRAAVDEAFAPLRRAAKGAYRGGTSGATSGSARIAGAAAADRANISSGTAIGGAKKAIGR